MAFFNVSGLSHTLRNESCNNESREDILQHLQQVQRQREMVRQCGRRQQSRKTRPRLGTRALNRRNCRRVCSFSSNSTASYVSEIRTPETVASVELSSRNFTVSFSDQHQVVEISSQNFTRSFALHRSKICQEDSTYRSTVFDQCETNIEPSMEYRTVNEISDIEHNSQPRLHYQASTSHILDGPLNSSIKYPNNSTPRRVISLMSQRSNLGDCVKALVFDNEMGEGSSNDSVMPISLHKSRDSSSFGSSTIEPQVKEQDSQPSSPSTATYTTTYTTFSTASSCGTSSFPENSGTTDPSTLDILSMTADSDTTAFLDKPLNALPVTAKEGKCRKSSKYRKMTKQLRSIGRQIQRGSKNLNLKTLAVI